MIERCKKGKSMLRDKNRHTVTHTSTILPLVVSILLLLTVSTLRANPGPDKAATAETFRTKCAMCHGPDGAGSAVGKSMNVPDLRSSVVQDKADTELAQIISNGKSGMPAFTSSFSDDQIHALVTYVRLLHQKK
jgi:mono/diheme cytochrome c family protein